MKWMIAGWLLSVATMVPMLGSAQSLEELEQQLKKKQASEQRRQTAEQQRKAAEAKLQASMGTLVVRVDRDCTLTVNGESRGQLQAEQTRNIQVGAGEQLIECAAVDDGRVEQVVTVEAGTQRVMRLQIPVPGRFEPVAGGVRDRQLGVVWAARDSGSDVNWSQAQACCAGLGAAWTLPSVVELQSLYDASGAYAMQVGEGTIEPATDRIGLTGRWYWSDEPDGSAKASFYLGYGHRVPLHVSGSYDSRALSAEPLDHHPRG